MHLHYSPFQFATGVEVSDYDVSGKKIVKTLKTITRKDDSKTKNMNSTMSCEEASRIPGTPNAFVSPNLPGTMKDMKLVMAPLGVNYKAAPKGHSGYDHTYRHRERVHYNDRPAYNGDALVV
jgi:hypothetical protein